MKTFHALAILTAMGFASAVLAQEPATPRSPTPSTSPAEGTAADRTQPGRTPTQGAAEDVAEAEAAADPRPATSQTEGTAADRSAPGQTPTRSGDTVNQAAQSGSADARDLVGASVVTRTNAQLGEVTDVVFDSKQQPAFVIIATENESTAVPYAAASSMMSGDKVVIDQAKLQSAPKVKEGEWRDQSSKKWQADAARYWNRG